MHRLLYSTWEVSNFSVTQNLEFSFEVRQQRVLPEICNSCREKHIDLLSVLRRPSASVRYSEIASCSVEGVYSL